MTDEQRAEARRLAEIVLAGYDSLDKLERLVGLKDAYILIDGEDRAAAAAALHAVAKTCLACDEGMEYTRVYAALNPSLIRAESLNDFLHGD